MDANPLAAPVIPQGPTMPFNWPPYSTSNSKQPPVYKIPTVNGEIGAKSFEMGPNSSILLADENSPVVWCVTTDAMGNKNSVIPYSLTQMETQEQTMARTINELGQGITLLLARMEKVEGALNVKSSVDGVIEPASGVIANGSTDNKSA